MDHKIQQTCNPHSREEALVISSVFFIDVIICCFCRKKITIIVTKGKGRASELQRTFKRTRNYGFADLNRDVPLTLP